MKDMGSTNGTYLNGGLIDKPVIIKNDDLIGIGGVVFKVID
jgi:pSer/pThr/pTyr-binding forkhead associated (FHA) protein